MAYRVVVSPSTTADIDDVVAYIANDSLSRVQRWLNELVELLQKLGDMPESFPIIAEAGEIGRNVRAAHHYSHCVVYEAVGERQEVSVLRIWHGARRDLQSHDLL